MVAPGYPAGVVGPEAVNAAGVEALKLTDSCRRVLMMLEQVPLCSARELSDMFGPSVPVVNRGLKELENRQLVGRLNLGAVRPKRLRWYVGADCSRRVGAGFGLWHDEWALCRLVDRLPVVEGIYEAASVVPGLGGLNGFQWFGRAAWDSVALYEMGWVAFVWSGLWQGEGRLRSVMGRLGRDFVRLSAYGGSAWPAVVCFVVHDGWQRELVQRAARREGISDLVGVYCMADKRWNGVVSPERCRGWVAEFVYSREMPGGAWDRKKNGNVWEVASSSVAWKILMGVAEWDRITSVGVRGIVGEDGRGRRGLVLLSRLVKAGYLDRRWNGNKYRYNGTVQLRRLIAGMDRVRRTGLPGGYGWSLGANERGLGRHEDGVMEVMGYFMARGLPCACGWRSWEHLGGGGGIAPDGMVLLESSPFGPGWHYVEYERRAQGVRRVGRKLNGYVAGGRQDWWPVLVVVENQRVEDTFQEVGAELGVRMATTQLGRLRAEGAFGVGVWNVGGVGTTLG